MLRDADEPLGIYYGDYYVWEVVDHLVFYLWDSTAHKFVDEIQPLPGQFEELFEL
jgi:hypothetical protein